MMTTTNGKSPTSSEIVLKPKRRRISAAEKLRILRAVEAAPPGTQGAVLRREGIFSSQLAVWRKQLEHGDLNAQICAFVSRTRIKPKRQPVALPNSKAKFASYNVASIVPN